MCRSFSPRLSETMLTAVSSLLPPAVHEAESKILGVTRCTFILNRGPHSSNPSSSLGGTKFTGAPSPRHCCVGGDYIYHGIMCVYILARVDRVPPLTEAPDPLVQTLSGCSPPDFLDQTHPDKVYTRSLGVRHLAQGGGACPPVACDDRICRSFSFGRARHESGT